VVFRIVLEIGKYQNKNLDLSRLPAILQSAGGGDRHRR
jgi:hypothetical protein